MKHTSVIELSKSALSKNIKNLTNMFGAHVKFASVVKGNAYGHGIDVFVKLAESCGINMFCVADSFEAECVLKVKREGSHIIIMSMIDNEDLEWAIENDISFYIFDIGRLEGALAAAKKVGKKARIHIELETGMNRTGFDDADLNRVIEIINLNREYFEIDGICTHYAGAESIANYVRIKNQIEAFNSLCEMLKFNGITAKYRHTACSAAALTYPETRMDMIRIGIAHYGFWPSKETKMYKLLSSDKEYQNDPLIRVIRWRTRIMDIKTVKPGKFINYGTSYLTEQTTKVAIIPVGYSHGYSRSLSNLGSVLIRRKKVPVIGMVNMNMILADVSNVSGVEKGDEVVLIGKQGNKYITVSSFSELSQNVNYEMLTRLPKDIPRIVVK